MQFINKNCNLKFQLSKSLQKRFIFSREHASAAYKLIEETFPESHSISIMDKQQKKLEKDRILDKKEKH